MIRGSNVYYGSGDKDPNAKNAQAHQANATVRARRRYRRADGHTVKTIAAAAPLELLTAEQLDLVTQKIAQRFAMGHQDVKVTVLNDELGKELYDRVEAMVGKQLTAGQAGEVYFHVLEGESIAPVTLEDAPPAIVPAEPVADETEADADETEADADETEADAEADEPKAKKKAAKKKSTKKKSTKKKD